MRACGACGSPQPIKWRDNGPIPVVEHIAGPVISSVLPRRSSPHYVVDRRQACTRCGRELVRGRWACFFLEGTVVLEHGHGLRAPILHYAYVDSPAYPSCA